MRYSLCVSSTHLLSKNAHRQEEVPQKRLDSWMQVKLWLLEHQGHIWLSQKTHHQNREHLADSDAYVRRDHAAASCRGGTTFEFVTPLSLSIVTTSSGNTEDRTANP